MVWLEAHKELVSHPKTTMLGELMGWNNYETAGRLLSFWFWCLDYAPTGDLRRFNDTQIGRAVELNGEAAAMFVKSAVASGWIDRGPGVFRVHDWPDFTKRYLKESRFKGRPDKWLEVLAVYADNSGLTPESLQTPTNHTDPTHPPTKGGAAGRKDDGRKAAVLKQMRIPK